MDIQKATKIANVVLYASTVLMAGLVAYSSKAMDEIDQDSETLIERVKRNRANCKVQMTNLFK